MRTVGDESLVPISDSASRQVIRRKFQRHTVAVHNFDPVAPESAGHRRQHSLTCVELYRKHSSLELFNNFPYYFYGVFFWHYLSFGDLDSSVVAA
jgi:hypothetical protein